MDVQVRVEQQPYYDCFTIFMWIRVPGEQKVRCITAQEDGELFIHPEQPSHERLKPLVNLEGPLWHEAAIRLHEELGKALGIQPGERELARARELHLKDLRKFLHEEKT